MTDKAVHFSVQTRPKTSSKKLRREGSIPANVYGLSQDSIALVCSSLALEKFIVDQGESGLLYLDIEQKKEALPVLIDEVQRHPAHGHLLHVSFRRVNLQKKISATVPLEFVGEIDILNATLVEVKNEVEIEALPADIPENIVIDLTSLTEVGQSILLKNIPIDQSKITLVAEEEELESPIVLVQEVKEEIEPEPEPEPVGEVEGAAEGADESGADKEKATQSAEPSRDKSK